MNAITEKLEGLIFGRLIDPDYNSEDDYRLTWGERVRLPYDIVHSAWQSIHWSLTHPFTIEHGLSWHKDRPPHFFIVVGSPSAALKCYTLRFLDTITGHWWCNSLFMNREIHIADAQPRIEFPITDEQAEEYRRLMKWDHM